MLKQALAPILVQVQVAPALKQVLMPTLMPVPLMPLMPLMPLIQASRQLKTPHRPPEVARSGMIRRTLPPPRKVSPTPPMPPPPQQGWASPA